MVEQTPFFRRQFQNLPALAALATGITLLWITLMSTAISVNREVRQAEVPARRMLSDPILRRRKYAKA